VFHNPNPLRARNRYQVLDLSSRMEGASPHRLVAILYEELQNALDGAIRARENGQDIVANSQMARARSILAALEAGLDFDRGGSLATTLCGVYRAMQRQLASATHDAQKLKDVKEGVAEIAKSWSALVT
jgi:flagellar protein FliS